MNKFSLIALALTSLMFWACGDSPEKEKTKDASFDLSKEKEWIQNELVKFANDFRKGDTAALAAYYSSDAVAMPPGMTSVMKKDIASMWGQAIQMGVKDITLNVTEVHGDQDLLVEVGTYEMYGDNKMVLEKGKYISVLKKENGTWKVFRDIWNSDAPVSAP